MIEAPKWKQIKDGNGVLVYEGHTLLDKPHGTGKSFFPNGNVYQEGDFGIKGLLRGKEYYPSGKLRFEGSFKICKGYGPNYPVNGKCYDKDGNLYYEGEIRCTTSGLGYHSVTLPVEYGPIAQAEKPDVPCFLWEEEEVFTGGKDVERDASMTLNEFTTFVEQGFFRRVDETEEARVFLRLDESQKLISDNYKAFIDPECFFGGFDPEATAGCLAMMFE